MVSCSAMWTASAAQLSVRTTQRKKQSRQDLIAAPRRLCRLARLVFGNRASVFEAVPPAPPRPARWVHDVRIACAQITRAVRYPALDRMGPADDSSFPWLSAMVIASWVEDTAENDTLIINGSDTSLPSTASCIPLHPENA